LQLITRVYFRSNFYAYGKLRTSSTFLQERLFGRSRSSKIVDFGTNRKCACDFLLVRYSNFGPISCTVSEIIAGFLLMTIHIPSYKFKGCSRRTRSSLLG